MNNSKAPQQNNMPPLRPMGGGPGARGPNSRLNAEKPKNAGRTLGRLLKYIGKSKLLVISLILIMVLVTVSDLMGPALQGLAIDTITLNEETGRFAVDMEAMLTYLAIMGVMFAAEQGIINFLDSIGQLPIEDHDFMAQD